MLGSIIPDMGIRSTLTRRGLPPRPASVANALFTKGQQRVLGVLFGNPGRSFYTSEIIALAGGGTGAVQRVLARLESAALVTTKRIGNQKHYQANQAAPVFTQLHKIVLRTFDLPGILRAGSAPGAPTIDPTFALGSIAGRRDSAASDRRDRSGIRVRVLDARVVDPASDLDARSPAERLDMVWQLTRDSWAFTSESEHAESRLQRHAVSVRRRAR